MVDNALTADSQPALKSSNGPHAALAGTCMKLRSVGITAAFSESSFLQAADATYVPKQLHFVRSVWDTAARWPRRPDEH